MKKLACLILTIGLLLSFSINFFQTANANDDFSEMGYIYQSLRMCRSSIYNTPYGDVRVQKGEHNTCYYSSTFQGNTFECKFPKQEAKKYGRYKSYANLAKWQYKEMKDIEKKYCK